MVHSVWSRTYIIKFFRVIFNKGRFYYSSSEWGITQFYNWSLIKCNIMIIRWHVCKNWFSIICCPYITFMLRNSRCKRGTSLTYDVLKTKTFGHSSFYYPPIFLCFISGKKFFITSLIFTERWIFSYNLGMWRSGWEQIIDCHWTFKNFIYGFYT